MFVVLLLLYCTANSRDNLAVHLQIIRYCIVELLYWIKGVIYSKVSEITDYKYIPRRNKYKNKHIQQIKNAMYNMYMNIMHIL